MIAAVLDHLWQSTLVALGAGVLVLAFRSAGAAVRHGLWLAASVKFLIPFAALAALGRLMAPAVRPPAAATPDAVFIERATQPFSQSHAVASAAHMAAPMAHAAVRLDPSLAVSALWLLGCAAVLAGWTVRWAKVRAAVRQATPLPWSAPMPVLASSSMLEPGLVGVRRPVLVVPKALPDHLSPPEIDALVAHEACHLRRRDNLTGSIHMLVEALFWFHPLVWWIGARLIDERERACDEAVVRSGHDRAAYARCLVETCRLFLQSPLPCVAGASGSDLTKRVQRIMTAPPCSPLSRARKSLLLAAGACALATPVAAGWLTSPAGRQAATRVAAIASDTLTARTTNAPAAEPAPAVPSTRRSDRAGRIKLATAAPAAPQAQPGPTPTEALARVTLEAAPSLSLTPLASVSVSRPVLTPVSDRTPQAGEPLGPGHYVQRSELKKSGDCSDGPPRRYTLSTPPIAPGHVITNFRYELDGDNRCDPQPGWQPLSASCELVADQPDRKTVRFALATNRNYCLAFRAFEQDGPAGGSTETGGAVTERGAVTRSRMVFSYDVR